MEMNGISKFYAEIDSAFCGYTGLGRMGGGILGGL